METVTIPKKQYEEMKAELERLRKQMEEDDLLEQVKESLEDVKAGRVTKA